MDFAANVAVARLEDSGGFMAEITVRCSACGLPFQFLGLEACIAIVPQGTRPNPLQRIAYDVAAFDG